MNPQGPLSTFFMATAIFATALGTSIAYFSKHHEKREKQAREHAKARRHLRTR
jgi:hypothetical protein